MSLSPLAQSPTIPKALSGSALSLPALSPLSASPFDEPSTRADLSTKLFKPLQALYKANPNLDPIQKQIGDTRWSLFLEGVGHHQRVMLSIRSQDEAYQGEFQFTPDGHLVKKQVQQTKEWQHSTATLTHQNLSDRVIIQVLTQQAPSWLTSSSGESVPLADVPKPLLLNPETMPEGPVLTKPILPNSSSPAPALVVPEPKQDSASPTDKAVTEPTASTVTSPVEPETVSDEAAAKPSEGAEKQTSWFKRLGDRVQQAIENSPLSEIKAALFDQKAEDLAPNQAELKEGKLSVQG